MRDFSKRKVLSAKAVHEHVFVHDDVVVNVVVHVHLDVDAFLFVARENKSTLANECKRL
jgi:hypothetical protein